MSDSLSSIQIVLVRPQIAENVGLTARSMKAFGVDSLVLVAPEFSWGKSSAAYKTASGAAEILDTLRLCDTLAEAAAACRRVVGFSRRTHRFARPRLELTAWAEQVQAERAEGEIALVFGPEDSGLSNEEKRLCEWVVTIPSAAESLSLNLAQAVTVVLYELFRTGATAVSPKTEEGELCSNALRPATHADLQRVMEHLTLLLDHTSFFKPGRREFQMEAVRNLVFRLQLSEDEIHTVMGILRTLSRLHPPKREKE